MNIKEKIANIDWLVLGGKLIGAIVVLIIGLWIVKIISKAIYKLLHIKKVDESLKQFILSLISAILKVIVVLAAAATAGIDLTVVGTIIAASTLAIGMALQGSLSNIAGGALIMFLKPFKIGDFIEAQGVKGIVKKIEIFSTKLNTLDNKEVIIPNGVLSNGNVVNYSSEGTRRVDIVFGVAYDSDIKQTKKVLLEVIESYPKILKDPISTVVVTELADSSINFSTRTWVKVEDYWDAYSYILEHGKIALDEAGIEIPYPTQVEISKKI